VPQRGHERQTGARHQGRRQERQTHPPERLPPPRPETRRRLIECRIELPLPCENRPARHRDIPYQIGQREDRRRSYQHPTGLEGFHYAERGRQRDRENRPRQGPRPPPYLPPPSRESSPAARAGPAPPEGGDSCPGSTPEGRLRLSTLRMGRARPESGLNGAEAARPRAPTPPPSPSPVPSASGSRGAEAPRLSPKTP